MNIEVVKQRKKRQSRPLMVRETSRKRSEAAYQKTMVKNL
jgi:hypothetical protein